jgi:protein phosphatase PTC7
VVAKVGGDAPSPPAPSVPARDPSKPPEPDTPTVPLGIASSGAVLVPHPDKAEKGGEDACFVLRDQGAFGVMDGVGGWADEGVDPAAYSNTFAERSAAAVLMGASDPRDVIRAAHERVKIVGSTTACVAILDGENAIVNVGNLGDAGAMIARGKEDYFRTPSQQHEFNCPFQLGCAEFYPESDGADDAETFSVHVRPGDALVMGSDGLWDNVPHAEVAQTVEACVRGGKDAQETAEAIATLAFEHSVDEEYDSPFTTEARNNGYDVEWWEKAKGKVLVGGKMDDIAVVVAFMDEKEKCPPPAPEDEDEDGTEARV